MPARLFMSSGDMNADRRFDYARDLQVKGDLVAAADLLEQATDLAPGFATAWFVLGEIREQLGDTTGAIAAFRCAQGSDAGDRNGAGLRLMRLGAADVGAMPPTYVTALFDQYAPTFDVSLVDRLGYRGPELLRDAVQAVCAARGIPMHFPRAIDLGCGTGLAAVAFTAHTNAIVGIDLSPRMISHARATGLYAELEVAEVVEGLGRQPDSSADLVIAADVLIYLHDLEPVLREITRVLVPGGVLAFTAETHEGRGVVLGAGLRYAQGEDHLRSLVLDAGLTLIHNENASSRTEGGIAVPGLVAVATKN